MRLSIEKLSALGWDPTLSSDETVRQGVREILENPENDPHLST
jgi:UDP-glucose 4-epimerase